MLAKVRTWEAKQIYASLSILRFMRAKAGPQEEDSKIYVHCQMGKNGAADGVQKIVDKNWTTMNWASNNGKVPVLGWTTMSRWRIRSAWSVKYQRMGQDGKTNSDSTTEGRSGIFRCRGGREKGRMGEAPKRKKPRDLEPLVLAEDKKTDAGNQEWRQNSFGLGQWSCQVEDARLDVRGCPESSMEVVEWWS